MPNLNYRFLAIIFNPDFIASTHKENFPSSQQPANLIAIISADLSPILFALMLTISYRVYNGFVYDHFELFALTFYIYSSLNKKGLQSIIILALAIINKETAVFFPLFGFAISYAGHGINKNNSLTLLAEIAIVVLGFLIIHYLMRNQPGVNTEWHALGNLDFWLSVKPISLHTSLPPHV